MDAALSGLPLFTPPNRSASTYPDGIPVEICDLFEKTALQVRAAGYDKFSARAIFHRLRWAENIEKGNREFKIDNCHSEPLARWLMAKHPEMAGFFELRGEDK